MNDETVAALNRINRRFYRRFADAFATTRSRPWPGWDRAIPIQCDDWPQEKHRDTLTILDVGCGNGRFAEYLSSRLDRSFRYFGVDDSSEMLALARQRIAAVESVEYRLRQCDLIGGGMGQLTGDWRFDLIVAFGLLHHLPGLERRQQLLQDLTEMLESGGLLLLSFWQFGEQERFQDRFLEWSEHNRAGSELIDLEQLETGDHLLAWGGDEDPTRECEAGLSPRRYCHYATENEAQLLVDSLGLSIRDSFRSDGRTHDLNLYYVLEKDREVAAK